VALDGSKREQACCRSCESVFFWTSAGLFWSGAIPWPRKRINELSPAVANDTAGEDGSPHWFRRHDRPGTMIRHANPVSAKPICTLTDTMKEPTSARILVSAIGGSPLLPTCLLPTLLAAIALAAVTTTAYSKESPAGRPTALSESNHHFRRHRHHVIQPTVHQDE
jgi:hypothetical protein